MTNRGEQTHLQETSRILRSCSQKSAETTQLLPATKERATRRAYSVHGPIHDSLCFFFSGDEISPFFDHEIGKRIGIFWVVSSLNSTFFLIARFSISNKWGKKTLNFADQ
jgi:hypothetical protein